MCIRDSLRPTSNHLPVARWAEPAEFDNWKTVGEAMGIGHIEAAPLTRSSYHAKQAAQRVRVVKPVQAVASPVAGT